MQSLVPLDWIRLELEWLTPSAEIGLGHVQVQFQGSKELGLWGASNQGENIVSATPQLCKRRKVISFLQPQFQPL